MDDELLDLQEEKKSWLNRFLNFLSKFAPKKKEKSSLSKYSKFQEYLLEIDKKDEAYSAVSYSIELCEEAIEIVKKRLVIIRKLQTLSESITEVECYNNLSEDDALYLKDLLQRIVSVAEDRKSLMYQVTGFNSSLTHLLDYEAEIPSVIVQMENAEQKQRIFNQDMAMLEGEKSNLEYEKENLERGREFVYKFSIFLLVIFGSVTMLLALLAVFQNIDIFFPITIMAFMVMLFTVLIYILRRQIKYELALNIKKQKKAVELLNKKSTLYVHYTNFLKYVCQKYQVRNSQMLRNNFSEFNNYKHLASRLDSITNILYQTENTLESFLASKNISNSKSTSLRFAKTLNIDDKKRYYNDLEREKTALENNLMVLDARHDEIWNQLIEINNSDRTKNAIIERIINGYHEEVSRYLELVETQFQDDENPDSQENLGEET